MGALASLANWRHLMSRALVLWTALLAVALLAVPVTVVYGAEPDGLPAWMAWAATALAVWGVYIVFLMLRDFPRGALAGSVFYAGIAGLTAAGHNPFWWTVAMNVTIALALFAVGARGLRGGPAGRSSRDLS